MSTATPSFDDLPVDGAPPIPGLRFRPYRGPADLPGLVAVKRSYVKG